MPMIERFGKSWGKTWYLMMDAERLIMMVMIFAVNVRIYSKLKVILILFRFLKIFPKRLFQQPMHIYALKYFQTVCVSNSFAMVGEIWCDAGCGPVNISTDLPCYSMINNIMWMDGRPQHIHLYHRMLTENIISSLF